MKFHSYLYGFKKTDDVINKAFEEINKVSEAVENIPKTYVHHISYSVPGITFFTTVINSDATAFDKTSFGEYLKAFTSGKALTATGLYIITGGVMGVIEAIIYDTVPKAKYYNASLTVSNVDIQINSATINDYVEEV